MDASDISQRAKLKTGMKNMTEVGFFRKLPDCWWWWACLSMILLDMSVICKIQHQAPAYGMSGSYSGTQADPSSTNQKEAWAGSANQRPGIRSADRAGQWESTLTDSTGRRVGRWWWPHRKSRWLTSRVTRINAPVWSKQQKLNSGTSSIIMEKCFCVIKCNNRSTDCKCLQ